jgi:MFS family permease
MARHCSFYRKELFYVLVICLCGFSIREIGTFHSSAGPEIPKELNLSDWQAAIFNAEAYFFASFGGFTGQFFISGIGRTLPSVLHMSGLLLTFVLISSAQLSFFVFGFAARAMQGLFMGALTALAPLCIIEIAPMEHRGPSTNSSQHAAPPTSTFSTSGAAGECSHASLP